MKQQAIQVFRAAIILCHKTQENAVSVEAEREETKAGPQIKEDTQRSGEA